MAWLTKGIRRYYYRKSKVAGKVISQYIGGGVFGELAERVDAQDRQQRQAEREAERRRREEQADLDAQIDAIGERLQELVTAALVASGYRQHKRQWRLQRGAEHSSG